MYLSRDLRSLRDIPFFADRLGQDRRRFADLVLRDAPLSTSILLWLLTFAVIICA
jgi:hypothetical protein